MIRAKVHLNFLGSKAFAVTPVSVENEWNSLKLVCETYMTTVRPCAYVLLELVTKYKHLFSLLLNKLVSNCLEQSEFHTLNSFTQ